ncbi:MAG: carbohydrate kinase family protein [Anaerolineales bacterium]|nr:carbohydrate kinase family protein [Anaerolineales bacterium]
MNFIITGSVAYDYIMSFPGYFRDHFLPDKLDSISLSFLVESMVRRRGGTAPNIAYSMALLGERPRIMATVGEDFEEYRSWLESKGVDNSLVRVIPGEFTASFFANTDRANAQIASFYPGAMAYASELSLQTILDPQPDLVVISPNDPKAMVGYVAECSQLGIPFLYDPSQQIPRLSDEDLCFGVENARALFINDYEFGLINKCTGLTIEKILERSEFIVITRGEQGSTIYTLEGETNIPIVLPERVSDPTGVGDAFRGGFLTGYIRKFDWETCGRMGALSATFCVENLGPQGHEFSPAEFVARFRRHFDDGGQLDDLLIT